jgi:chromosome segregation ATPase
MNNQQLEEINDQLQMEIESLKEQLRNAPSPEIEQENVRLQAENEDLREQLEKTEAQRANLGEMLRVYQERRKIELQELEEARRSTAELREIELNRLAEASARVAQQQEELAEERKRMKAQVAQERKQISTRVAALEAEVSQANTTTEGWKRQAVMAADRTLKAEAAQRIAEGNLSQVKYKVQSLEINNAVLSRQHEELLENPSKPQWIQLIEVLSAHPGWVLVALMAVGLLYLVIYIVSWIVQWLMR